MPYADIFSNDSTGCLILDSSSSVPAINGNTPVLTPSLVSDMETLSMEPSNYSNYSRQISVRQVFKFHFLNNIILTIFNKISYF